MKTMGFIALLLSAPIAGAGASPLVQHVGDTYEITLHRESVQQSNNGSSGSTNDNDAIVERVVAMRSDGLELEYDLPQASAEDRAEYWQFPARVFRPFNGPSQLLNSIELENRLDAWLKAAKWSRAVCGKWIFTWNAFHIECDPQSVIKDVEAFDLKAAGLDDGVSYRDAEAGVAGTISKKASGPDGAIFAVEMPVDPDAFRHARAEADVVTGAILKRPMTLETALQNHAKETVSGTISVRFETNASGAAYRRTKVTKLEITEPGGKSETETVTETLDRRLISQGH